MTLLLGLALAAPPVPTWTAADHGRLAMMVLWSAAAA